MDCCSIYPPKGEVGPIHVWGWRTGGGIEEEIDKRLDSDERRYVNLNTVANIAGYILSPLIGLIRIIVNAFFLIKGTDSHGLPWSPPEEKYLMMQIVRGVAELCGMGPLLLIPDLIVTINTARMAEDTK